MRRSLVRLWAFCCVALPVLWGQPSQLPSVQEATLPNGVRVLLLERPGTGAVHLGVTLGRPQPDPSGAPAVAYELLRQCLAGSEPANAPSMEALLLQEDGLWIGQRQPGASQKDLAERDAQLRMTLETQRHASERLFPASHSTMSADELQFGWDLSPEEVEPWAQNLAARLRAMLLSGFPEARRRLTEEARPAAFTTWARALHLLIPTGLGAGPYVTSAVWQREAAAAVRWQDLRNLGHLLAAPHRMTVVAVGNLRQDKLLALLRSTLGTLSPSPDKVAFAWRGLDAFGEGWTGRRIKAFRDGEARVLMALRVPAQDRCDPRALAVLAEFLAGSPASRFWRHLVTEQHLASWVRIHPGVPGTREAHLLLIEAEPTPGRSLEELEQGMQGMLARLLREGVSREEVREAQLRVEAAETLRQDDAASLAQALGQAQARTGAWDAAFPLLRGGTALPETTVHQLLQALAHPTAVFTLSLEPDSLLTPQDAAEARLIALLKERVGKAVQDPASLDSILRQSVQQLRLLSSSERAHILALLQAETK